MTRAAIHVHAADTELAAWHDPERGDVKFRRLIDAAEGPAGDLVQGIAEFEQGGRENPHTHDVPETGFVLEGEGLLTLDGRDVAVRAGDMLYMPAGLAHGWSAPDGALRVLFTFPADRLVDVAYHWEAE